MSSADMAVWASKSGQRLSKPSRSTALAPLRSEQLFADAELIGSGPQLSTGSVPGSFPYWDPATTLDQPLAATDSPAGKKDAFCAGHVALGDGRVIVVGGEDGTKSPTDTLQSPTGINTVWIFDPASPGLVEQNLDPMAIQRWYGTPNVLPDGRMSVVSGFREPDPAPERWFRMSEKPEIYDPYKCAGSRWSTADMAGKFDTSVYAWMRLIPGGTGTRLLYLGPGHTNYHNSRALKNLEILGDLETALPTWTIVTSPAEQLRGGFDLAAGPEEIPLRVQGQV